MAGRETQVNRPKVNYPQRHRDKVRQTKAAHAHELPRTIDAKKARQMKLFARKQKRKEEKKLRKENKMQDEN